MRIAFCYSLSEILFIVLAATPGRALPFNPGAVPLGTIVQMVRSQGGADIASGGATICEGDWLETQEDEILSARLNSSHLYLRPVTLADVHALPNGFSARLMRGAVVISSPAGHTFELQIDGAAVRSADADGSAAWVTWVNPNEFLVTSERGTIEISVGNEIQRVMPGESHRVEVETEPPEPQTPGSNRLPSPTGSNHLMRYVAGGAGVATAIGIWRAVVSPCAP